MTINVTAMIQEARQRQSERDADTANELAERFFRVFGYPGGSWLGIFWKVDSYFQPVGELDLSEQGFRVQFRYNDDSFQWNAGSFVQPIHVQVVENTTEERQANNRDQLLIALGKLIEQVDRNERKARLSNK